MHSLTCIRWDVMFPISHRYAIPGILWAGASASLTTMIKWPEGSTPLRALGEKDVRILSEMLTDWAVDSMPGFRDELDFMVQRRVGADLDEVARLLGGKGFGGWAERLFFDAQMPSQFRSTAPA